MASDSISERLKKFKEMDLATQQEEMLKALIELAESIEKLDKRINSIEVQAK